MTNRKQQKNVELKKTVSTGEVIQAPAGHRTAVSLYCQWAFSAMLEKRRSVKSDKSLDIL